MNKATAAQPTKTKSILSSDANIFQHKCVYGKHTSVCGKGTEKNIGLQRKLAMGEIHDPLEQEADRVADQVAEISSNNKIIGNSSHIHRFSGQSNQMSDEAIGNVNKVFSRPGRPLDTSLKNDMEQRFGYDFSQVRVHTGSIAEQSAKEVNANAYTVGTNIVFGEGRFSSQTRDGRRLLAHELTHVVQQSGNECSFNDHGNEKNRVAGLSCNWAMGRVIQRQPASSGVTLSKEEEITTPGLITEDTATEVQPGRMKKSEFLAELRTEICRITEVALAGTGRSASDCPYIKYWFAYYSGQDSRHIERAIRRYAPETSNVGSARSYIPLIAERARRGVEEWVRSGQIIGVPDGLLNNDNNKGSGISDNTDIRFKGRDGGARMPAHPEAVRSQLGYGYPLDGKIRSGMESVFGTSFSHVRVHTDTTASKLSDHLNARAFTVGDHIAFGSSEYRPGSVIGDAIIAHELAHVIQQGKEQKSTAQGQRQIDSYDRLEADADDSAVNATISLWERTKGFVNGIRKNIMPQLKSGLQLQACRRTVKQCPKGLRWGVVGQPTATGPVCVCAWRCLPPGVGYSLYSSSGGSSGPTVSCTNRDRFGRCPGEPDYETVDEDYEIKNQGTVVGVGAHMSPLGGQAACGCLPLDLEGDPTGQKEVHAPLLAPGLDVTDIAGIKGRSPRTGEIQPGSKKTTKPPVRQQPAKKADQPPPVSKPPAAKPPAEKPPETKPPAAKLPAEKPPETKSPSAKPQETKPVETKGDKPSQKAATKPATAPEKTPQEIVAEKLGALETQKSSKQAALDNLQQRTRELEKKIIEAENDRQAASREYDKATTPQAKQEALAKMKDAVARREANKEALEKTPSDESLKREVKELDRQIEAAKPKPAQGQGRDPADVAREKESPVPPPPKETGKIGDSKAQDAELQKDIQEARSLGATDIRVNQEQVNGQKKRVGINRPDLQYTLPDGTRVYIEYDSTTSGRGPDHKKRILANDPSGKVVLKIID